MCFNTCLKHATVIIDMLSLHAQAYISAYCSCKLIVMMVGDQRWFIVTSWKTFRRNLIFGRKFLTICHTRKKEYCLSIFVVIFQFSGNCSFGMLYTVWVLTNGSIFLGWTSAAYKYASGGLPFFERSIALMRFLDAWRKDVGSVA